MFRVRWLFVGIVSLALGLSALPAVGQMKVLPRRVPAPSLDGGVDWINVSGPIALRDLRGKFVLLDFWTYCCINCLQILPELKALEREFPNELVAIGVHSAKFTTERETENIRKAVLRYEIEHPVINDAHLILWRKFGVSVWPTLIVVDPEGFVIAHHQGEIAFEDLKAFFRPLIARYRARRLLDETPVRFDLELYRPHDRPLRFPGKVLADAAGDRLFIADSGHHRIVVTALDGRVRHVIGSGAIGSQDGDFQQASFDHPQGMALYEGNLYVADTENHLIRKIDFEQSRVTTVAGNGKQARAAARRASVSPTGIPLASPWDLLVHGDELYIAMAGLHQIWRMKLDGRTIGPFAGNAIEDIVDGPLLPPVPYQRGFSSFAQPSGLATDGQQMFVADSEGSSIRMVPFQHNRQVATLVGTANLPTARLFTFGDRDGPAGQALLQHPIGVSYADGQVFVADTYNHKIKRINLDGEPMVSTLAGGSADGAGDEASLNEPSGLSAAGGKLFIADTNHHRIAVIDLAADDGVKTLNISGLQPPAAAPRTSVFGSLPDATMLSFPPTEIRPQNGEVSLLIDLKLPQGYKINPAAPTSFVIQTVGGSGPLDSAFVDQVHRVEPPEQSFPLAIPLTSAQGAARIKLSLVFYYCQEGAEAVCKIGNVRWTGELSVSAEAATEILVLGHEVR